MLRLVSGETRCKLGVILLCVFGWVSPSVVSAQLSIPQGLLGSGVKFERFEYDGFRQMLQASGLVVESVDFQQALRQPRKTIIVILGGTDSLSEMKSRIYTFYKCGGAVLVANDQTDKNFLFDFRTQFNVGDGEYALPDTLMGFNDCPLVRDVDSEVPLLFDNVEAIATNRPGFLSFRDGDAQSYTAAWLPADSRGFSESFVAIRRYKSSPGRLLAVADHSVFTNQMLPQGSNLTFASNVVAWLTAGEKRKKLIFIRDGYVMPTYSLGSNLPPIPPDELLEAMSDVLEESRPDLFDSSFREFTNKAIGSLQETDFFNFALHKWQARLRRSFARRGAVLSATTLMVVVMLVRVMTSRKREPLLKSGQMMKRKDHSATARLLIRDFFVSDNLTDRPEAARPVAVADRWWKRWRLQRVLRQLWKYGTADVPKRTSAKQLEKLRKRLRKLDDLRGGGQLGIQWEQ